MKNIIGNKICIIGLSSSGKSTLAKNISQKRNIPALHMDQIAFKPNTEWEKIPHKEYLKLHNKLIEQNKWVIEGSYINTLPTRLAKADTLIFIKINRFLCLFRFIIRAFQNKERLGIPNNMPKTVSFDMIKYILIDAPKKFSIYEEMIKENSHLNVLRISSFKEIDKIVENL